LRIPPAKASTRKAGKPIIIESIFSCRAGFREAATLPYFQLISISVIRPISWDENPEKSRDWEFFRNLRSSFGLSSYPPSHSPAGTADLYSMSVGIVSANIIEGVFDFGLFLKGVNSVGYFP